MAKNKKIGSSSKKGTQIKKELTPFELLKKSFEKGNIMEAIRLCETEQFTSEQIETVVKLAYHNQNYTFLRTFQDHFRYKDGFTLTEDVGKIILNNREERDYECYDRFRKSFKSADIKRVKDFYYRYRFSESDAIECFEELMTNSRVKDSGKFKFLEDLCLYLRDCGVDPVIYVSLMARKDKKYLEWGEKNGLAIDWCIYSGNTISNFRLSPIYSDRVKYESLSYERESVFVPFKEGNLYLAKSVMEYMSYSDLKKAVREAIKNKHFEFLKELAFYFDENGYEKASRFIATELVKYDVDTYSKWAYENEIRVDWTSDEGVYVDRSIGNGDEPTKILWSAYEAAMWPAGGAETNTPDLKVFISRMNSCNLKNADWTNILRYVSHKPEQIDTFLKPLCQYLIETNQISVCQKMFETASKNGFTECAVVLSSALTCADVVAYKASVEIVDGSIKTNDYGYVNGTGKGDRSAAIELARLLSQQMEDIKKYPTIFDEEYSKLKEETLEKMACLLNNGIDLNLVDSSNKNVLDYLLANDVSFQEDVWFDCINLILEQDSFEIPTDKTPYLVNAIKLLPSSRDVVIKLIRRAPELIVQKDANGQDAVMLATKMGDASLIEYLLSQAERAGIQLDYSPNERVGMILSLASGSNGLACFQKLYVLGKKSLNDEENSNPFDVNQKKSNGYTALHLAIQKKDIRALDNLLRFGADDQIKTPGGKTVDELIAQVGFTEGAEVLKKARAARERIMIVDENDLLKFVSYATPEQFSKFQENHFTGITDAMIFEAISKAKRLDLLSYVSSDLNVGEHSSDTSRKTLLEQAAALNSDSLDGVFVFADKNSNTEGIQGVVRTDYNLFCDLKEAIATFDLASFNHLIEQVLPELLLRYNSQGVNLIAFVDEQVKMMTKLQKIRNRRNMQRYSSFSMESYQLPEHQPKAETEKEKELLDSPHFDEYYKSIQFMRNQLIQKTKTAQKGEAGVHFLSSPYLPADQSEVDMRLKKALKEKDVQTVCSLIMDKKLLPSKEDRYATMELLIQSNKHKELGALLELVRGEGMLADFIEPFRDGLGVREDIWGEGYKYFDMNTSDVLREYCEVVYDNHDFNISYEGAARFDTGGQFAKYNRSDHIYFLTVAQRVFPPKETGYAAYNRKNVVDCFKKKDFIEKYPEALEIFLKQAKDHGCLEEVLGYFSAGDKANSTIAAVIKTAKAYLPVPDRISEAVLRKNVEGLERLVLNELDVPAAEDRERIATSLDSEEMESVMFYWNQPSADFAIKTETVFPKKEDRYTVLTLLIEHNKHAAVKELLTRAKEAGILKEFLYLQSPKMNTSLTPIEQILKSDDQKMKDILLSVVADTQLDFLEDQKPYEQMIRDAILRKDEKTITSMIQKQKYIPAPYQSFDTMKILIEKRNINTVETLLTLMKSSGEDLKKFLNTPDKNGVTLLMLAAASNDTDMIDLLLKNGADLSLKDKKGNTVFEYATTKTMKEHLNKVFDPEQAVATTGVLGHSAQDITQETSVGMDTSFKMNRGGGRLS